MNEPDNVVFLKGRAEPDPDTVLEGELVDGPPDDEDEEEGGYYPNPIVEHAQYLAAGVVVVSRNTWRSRSTSTYDRMMDAAAAVGDHEKALEWEKRRAEFQNSRHARRFDWIELPARMAGALPMIALVAVGGTLLFGILLAIATKDVRQIVAPILWIAAAVHLFVVIVTYAWLPALLIGIIGAGWGLWRLGINAAENGDIDWLASSADPDIDIEIDETTIARALGALRIQQITAHLKEGLPFQFIVTARRDGRGTHAVLRLPAGVTADQIGRRRAQLATGLYRAAKETWPTTGDEAGILDLWIADKGALAEGAGPHPLLDEGFVDYFKGVPLGKILRGDPIAAPMAGRNSIVGGMPDQGKSSAARVMLMGALLDPTVEGRVWVPDSNYDFEVFKPRLSRYEMGADDETIEKIRDDLRELYEEIQTRGELLVKHKEPEVTRKVANTVRGLHPIVGLLEEAHVAMNHPEFGKEIRWLAVEIVKLGRKRAIHLIVSTQAPTKDSMPRDVTRNCSNGIAFAVGDHVANDALLGQGAYSAGHRATDLIPGTDKGTALCKGLSGQRSEMVQIYFLSVRHEADQVTPLIERSLAEIARRGRAVPGTGRARPARRKQDALADIAAVLDIAAQQGEEKITVAALAHRLKELAPDWPGYQIFGTQIADQIIEKFETTGIKVITTGKGKTEISQAAFHKAVQALPADEREDGWEVTS